MAIRNGFGKFGKFGNTFFNQSQLLGSSGGSAVESDPFFSSVSLLLHMEGANGSTTFTDSSSNSRTVTAGGDAKISTAQKKYGNSSGLFDGSGDYCVCPGVNFFGTQNFTIEGFFRATNWGIGVTRALWGHRSSSGFTGGAQITFTPSGGSTAALLLDISSSSTGSWFAQSFSTGLTISQDIWYHIALVRNGSTITPYLNGVAGNSVTVGSLNIAVGGSFTIGSAFTTGQYFPGNIDEFRVTQLARYTSGFTPPSKQFPDS